MSGGREELIYHSIIQIHDWLLQKGIPSYKVENAGTPVESLKEQIKQAIPTYQCIENELRNCIESGVVGDFYKFGLADGPLSPDQAQEFFLEPSNMKSIYQRQCLGRVKDEMRKYL